MLGGSLDQLINGSIFGCDIQICRITILLVSPMEKETPLSASWH